MLGMHTLHIKVVKTAVPQYWVALGSECNTSAGTRRESCRGSWRQLWLVGQEVEAVPGWFQHTHPCGDHDQAIIRVSREDEFTTVMRLHPTGTKEATNATSRARGEVMSVQRMKCTVDELARR
jgi:hypothetical protein